jgi:NAD(P)-dependent dehydrogenase (short-subunit alcohol dehydrogenase family)
MMRSEQLAVSSPFQLEGKVALVTGSSRGIGRAIAEMFAAAVAKVVISSRKQDACDEVAAAINARHGAGRAMAVAASIASRDDLAQLLERTDDAFGRLDVLVCNAASNPHYGPMSDMSDDQFRKIMENNVVSTNWLIHQGVARMPAKGGSVIIVSSIGGLAGSKVAMLGGYNVSKAADLQLCRILATEYGPRGVRVNAIAPGLIQTDFARKLWEDPETRDQLAGTIPLRRIGQPDDVAGAALDLACEASAFMTGQTLVVDGGATA